MVNHKNIINLAIFLFLLFLLGCSSSEMNNASESNEYPNIFPDYKFVTFPVNIAPANFVVNDSASKYFVKLSGKKGNDITLASKNGNIKIPENKWKRLLLENLDDEIEVNTFLEQNGQWVKMKPFTYKISSDSLDSYLYYRFINPANVLWKKMGIYERNIENFNVRPIIDNVLTDNNCMHCHSFAANDANNFMLHMRGKPGGTLVYSNGKTQFVNTKTEQTISAGGYPAWHPKGNIIAFSTNKITQKFHSSPEKYAFVQDNISNIVLYIVDENKVVPIPELASPDFENMPTWSPEGDYLYYIQAPEHKTDTTHYKNIRYSLMRISFNSDKLVFGEPEIVVNADDINKSVTFPRVSPDNKFVVMSLAEYGYFNVYNETSDIVLLDLKTREILKPNINSDDVESYPSWSSNGKWLMFNSKRADGVSSRPYFAYFADGTVQKPFILPQKDGNWNFKELFNINRPELAKNSLSLNPKQILKIVSEQPLNAQIDMAEPINIDNIELSDTNSYNTFDFNQ